MKKSNFFKKVYEVVEKIPAGKVMTYGQISSMLNAKWQMLNEKGRITPRIVGFALHANSDPNTPCHRVVNKDGKVADSYAFEGWQEQKRRLVEESVTFIDEKRVDLGRHLLKETL